MITAGIDCGAKNTNTVILKDGQVIGKGSILTGFDQEKAVEESLEKALQAAGISRDDVNKIGGTGSGKNSIKMADTLVNDIKAMRSARQVQVRLSRPWAGRLRPRWRRWVPWP